MPGYFWPQVLTWNIEEDLAFYVDPDFKTDGFLSSIVLRCDEARQHEFHQLKLESTQNQQLQKPWNHYPASKIQQVIHSLGLVHLFCLFLLLRAEIRIFPKMRPSCCDADYWKQEFTNFQTLVKQVSRAEQRKSFENSPFHIREAIG